MTWHQGLFAEARRRVRASVLIPLVGGNALLLVAVVLGLEIPDSHAWQILLSLLLGLGLLLGLLVWNATALRRLRNPGPTAPLWQGAVCLGGWLLLGAVLIYLAGLGSAGAETRAGYWNSQMPAGMRHLLTYSRLIELQRFAIGAVQRLLIPATLLPFAMETAALSVHRNAWKDSLRVLASPQHWIVAILALGTADMLIPLLVVWHPAYSIAGEEISALLRLGAAVVLALAAALLLLATDAELLHRSGTQMASGDAPAAAHH